MPLLEPQAIASVILDQALDKPLDYLVPAELKGKLKCGMRVEVPVRNAFVFATVFEIKEKSAVKNLKAIQALLPENSSLTPDLFALARWISHYYSAPLHKVLKMMLPVSLRKNRAEKQQLLLRSSLSRDALLSYCEKIRQTQAKQAEVLDVLLKHPKGILLTALLEKAQVTRSPIQTLIKKEILTCSTVASSAVERSDHSYFPTRPKQLTHEQSEVLSRIQHTLRENHFQTRLLHGVTGSGKTEIYLQAIQSALEQGKGVIFLVPEIALTSQTIERLKGRFQEKIALLHHRIAPGARAAAWHKIRLGEIPIVIGARSAVFSPVPNLGLLIVDEEHDTSYKQSEEQPAYHARDVAVMRAKFCNALALLGSATPSLESYRNALSGKYALDILKTRPDSATLPLVHCVDMRREYAKARGFTLFSEPLLSAIEKRLACGEQTLLLLNRRGYRTAQLCKNCQKPLQCPHCDLSLTFHLGENLLACHLCDFRLSPLPRRCPYCQAEGDFIFRGAGTEMVERALHALFPTLRTLRIDADTTRHKGSHELLFKQFKAGKADLLIGTQMIAKGLDFPSVTLVGILNADASLQIPDFRAGETLFQLLTQVAGRAGRSSLPGEVIIQTGLPDHPLILLAKEQNYEGFYALESETRAALGFPPFTHLVKLLFSGKKEQQVKEQAAKVRSHLLSVLAPSFHLYPVHPCGHARIKAKYRFQFLIKGEKVQPLLPYLAALRAQKHPSAVRLFIDVDPLSTYF